MASLFLLKKEVLFWTNDQVLYFGLLGGDFCTTINWEGKIVKFNLFVSNQFMSVYKSPSIVLRYLDHLKGRYLGLLIH